MKKLLRTTLCAALLAVSVSIPAFAAESDGLLISPAPISAHQGDFGVLVNGKGVTFTDAVPKIQNDRSCLPFVAVFEQLGFAEKDMTWDNDTGTVTATKGDTTVKLTIGEKKITLIKDGETTVIETDVAPYIEPGLDRTYVPFGLVADALNYNVGWDNDNRMVLIDDVDAILAENDETYELMEKYLDYSKSYAKTNQKISGDYDMDMAMKTAEGKQVSKLGFTVDGDYEMLMSGSTAFQFETDMTMDAVAEKNGEDVLDEVMSSEERDMFPLDIDLEMRGDLADGAFYLQSEALSELMGQPNMTNAWFKFDFAGMFDQMGAAMGMNYRDLVALSSGAVDMDFEEYLASTLKTMPLSSYKSTTSDSLKALNALLGDSAFQKSGSKYVSTMEQDGVKVTFTLYTKGSKITGYAMEMTADDPVFGEMQMLASMKDDQMEMSMEMDMTILEEKDASMSMTMEMNMDGTYRSTSSKPDTEPPAKATIIDFMNLMGGAFLPMT